MKVTLLLFCLSVTICFAQDKEGFVIVKSEPPIELSERWVEFPNKKPAVTSRELKTEAIVNSSINKLIKAIKDESIVEKWHAHIADYKVFLKEDTTTWEEYSRHDIPWPMSDQDTFLEYKLREIVPGSEYLVVFKSKVDKQRFPVYEDVNRVELVGSWRFILLEPGRVKVIYRVQSAPTTHIPRMIVDPVIRNNLVSSIRSLTEIVEK